METIEVHHVEPGEKVHCYYCMRQNNYRLYARGEAFLTGPDHSPLDGNANHICMVHLDEGAVVYEPAAVAA